MAEYIAFIAGSSSPLPRAVVERMIPLMKARVRRRLISFIMAPGGEERGRVAKA